MEQFIDVANDSDPPFSIVSPGVFDGDRGLEVYVGKAPEADAAFSDVPGVLGRIELERHDYIVYTIKSGTQIDRGESAHMVS